MDKLYDRVNVTVEHEGHTVFVAEFDDQKVSSSISSIEDRWILDQLQRAITTSKSLIDQAVPHINRAVPDRTGID